MFRQDDRSISRRWPLWRVALYAMHRPEVVRLMSNGTALRDAVLDGLLVWQPHAEAWTAGDRVTISAEQARAVDVVVERLARIGSRRLRDAIETERRAHPPGLSFAQAVLRAIGRQRGAPDRN